jgi:hypothetical protein
VLAELLDSAVEGFDGAVGAGDHNASFHDGEDVGGEGVRVGIFGETVFDAVDAFADCGDPALKVFSDEFMGGAVLGVDFEGEAAEGTAVAAFGLKNAIAVAGEDGEDALDGLIGEGEGGIDHHGAEGMEVAFEDFAEKGFFAFKEVIEAAGVDLGMREEVGHAGAGITALPEEEACGVDEAVAGREGFGHGKIFLTQLGYRALLERSTKRSDNEKMILRFGLHGQGRSFV